MGNALQWARDGHPQIVEFRRRFHQHPEVAWEEIQTTAFVAEHCRTAGLNVRVLNGRTGLVADLNGERAGAVLAFRADLDALPIQEEGSQPFRSKVPGKAHVCGHDAHTAMLLGAVSILSRMREQFPFPIRFLFQPAEEVVPGGAKAFIDAGFLDGVGEIFGLHVTPQLPVGVIGTRSGPLMASMDRFELAVTGRGGHGAMPHLTHDPIPVAAEIILALQTIIGRRVDPLEPAVVSVCQIAAGDAFNVIPQECRMAGTSRSLSSGTRKRLEQWIGEISEGVAKAHEMKAALKYEHGTPVLANHSESVDKILRCFRTLGGRDQEIPATMGGEDFAYYLERVSGCFAFLGAGSESTRDGGSLHHPRFEIDEDALAWGSATFVQLALDRAAQG
jgi:amidohydrolase